MPPPKSFTFTQNYIIYRPVEQGVYPIEEAEWERLKNLISAIVPQKRIFKNLSSISFGIWISSIFQLISLPSESTMWLGPTVWAIFSVSFLMSVALLFLDREQNTYLSVSSQLVISEMTLIERQFDHAKEAPTNSINSNDAPGEQLTSEEPIRPQLLQDNKLKVGDIVYHGLFGIGKVINLEKKPNATMAIVNFNDHGVKRLHLKYARLTKVEIPAKGRSPA